ncbi:MAG TPA: hypothetical protein V6D26_16160 [Stenomitos sp.]
MFTVSTLFLAILTKTPQEVMTLTMSLTIGMYIITRLTEVIVTQNKDHLVPWGLRVFVGIIAVFLLVISPSIAQIDRVMILIMGLAIGIYIITQIIKVMMVHKREYFAPWYVRILAGITTRLFAAITLLFCLLAMLSLLGGYDLKTFD